MKNLINWKLFFILLASCVAASVLVVPYQLALTQVKPELSPMQIVLSAIVNALIMFAVATFLGLFFSKKVAMGLPILEGILKKENKTKELKGILLPSVLWGILAGVLIVILSIPFNKMIPEFQGSPVSAPAWKGFLASFYGGIAEEVLLRLFVVSLLVWITFKIKKSRDGSPTVFGVWLSIVLAAVLFGLGHLPATMQIVESLNGIIVARAVVLNGAAGIIFGWLYWKRGLESAMIAHFSTDIVLHVVTPLFLALSI